jgi:long-subunit acyl-CoA synthetase (AMP-forming)
LIGKDDTIDYQQLSAEIETTAVLLARMEVSTLGLDLDNGITWAILDLAALSAGITLVPIPPFFSPEQVRHCIASAGIDAVISDSPETMTKRAAVVLDEDHNKLPVLGKRLSIIDTLNKGSKVENNIVKVTFTSGTTAEPKGVLLQWQHIEQVVTSLATAVNVRATDRHLVLTPISVLLENIAGLYVPLWSGATAVIPPMSETGMKGASGIDVNIMLKSLHNYAASTAILTPQTMQALVEVGEEGKALPAKLRFAAVGGATVSEQLLARADKLGLAVFQGYGLSECASVTTLNTPEHNKRGSVGRPLPHQQLRISEDGEVLVKGNLFSGYLGENTDSSQDGWWHTGDLGRLDEDGFLFLSGRRRNVFITTFGRNVSPEWVERELVLEPTILQAAVFGEAKPWNTAVIVTNDTATVEDIADAVSRTNSGLPDYAQVSRWVIADEPFSLLNGQLSGTGRIRRHVIQQTYEQRIESLYQEELVP